LRLDYFSNDEYHKFFFLFYLKVLRERLTRKEELLRDYEKDLGKLRQAEILLRDKDVILQDLEVIFKFNSKSKKNKMIFLDRQTIER
jgi:hypothetical protein